VRVEGTFDSLNRGHLGGFGGTIQDLRRLDVWERPPDPNRVSDTSSTGQIPFTSGRLTRAPLRHLLACSRNSTRKRATSEPGWTSSCATTTTRLTHELEHLLQRHLTIQWKLAAARGCEYYELKTRAASLSKGDPVVFVDSDVIPEPEWLAELLACFDDPVVEVACGSTFIDPESLSGKAFALFCSFRSVRYAEKSAGCRSSTPTTWPFAAGRSSAFRSRTSWTRRGAPACSLRSV
jgi:Glycosyl transferase family 2